MNINYYFTLFMIIHHPKMISFLNNDYLFKKIY